MSRHAALFAAAALSGLAQCVHHEGMTATKVAELSVMLGYAAAAKFDEYEGAEKSAESKRVPVRAITVADIADLEAFVTALVDKMIGGSPKQTPAAAKAKS